MLTGAGRIWCGSDQEAQTPNERTEVTATPAEEITFADGITTVYTVSTVSVTAVHKGGVTVGETVRAKQSGGRYKGVEYRAERYELATELSYLMFLETYDDGVPASLLNPTQAAYQIAADGSYVGDPGNDLPMSRTTLDSW